MPDLQDFDSAIPIVVKDLNRFVATHKVNFSGGAADELAIVG